MMRCMGRHPVWNCKLNGLSLLQQLNIFLKVLFHNTTSLRSFPLPLFTLYLFKLLFLCRTETLNSCLSDLYVNETRRICVLTGGRNQVNGRADKWLVNSTVIILLVRSQKTKCSTFCTALVFKAPGYGCSCQNFVNVFSSQRTRMMALSASKRISTIIYHVSWFDACRKI